MSDTVPPVASKPKPSERVYGAGYKLIGKNYPTEVGIIGDAKSVLEDLLAAVAARTRAWRRRSPRQCAGQPRERH